MLQTMVFGEKLIKISPIVWKIKALQYFKMAVMKVAILYYQSREQFLKSE